MAKSENIPRSPAPGFASPVPLLLLLQRNSRPFFSSPPQSGELPGPSDKTPGDRGPTHPRAASAPARTPPARPAHSTLRSGPARPLFAAPAVAAGATGHHWSWLRCKEARVSAAPSPPSDSASPSRTSRAKWLEGWPSPLRYRPDPSSTSPGAREASQDGFSVRMDPASGWIRDRIQGQVNDFLIDMFGDIKMWAFRGYFEGYGKFLHGYLSGAEFALVRIDQSLLDNEELVREVSDCKKIGEAFSSGYLIAWPSAFIREKDN
ncbi:leucine-rich repeat extensin-like protein 5 [Hordeum vulgare subsp. vulgare]|uniref:leucine-rich repeat extensin-like protein 5 n=1 Tax=Hordeum vulgare subsp. vulgare TaxID=112509 RepID=UPI001D1A3776|nr:leucine-rich repeat extensin-like protein 5 [Hordeum vulgare subsp. vulgare]